MTEPEDRELQGYLSGDHPLRSRYRDTRDAEPPASLDAAILAQAKAATARASHRRRRRWALPLGLAATLVLGLPLGWQLWRTPDARTEMAQAPPVRAVAEHAEPDAPQPVEDEASTAEPAPSKSARVAASSPPPQAKRERAEAPSSAPLSADSGAGYGAPPALMAAPAPEPPPVIGYHGFGPAMFGDDEESVRMSWGRPLAESGAEPARCQVLTPEPASANYGIRFLLVDGRFARYEVSSTRYLAPGGGQVGDSADTLQALYPDGVDVQPHPRIEGGALWTVTPSANAARLVFEIGSGGYVTRWRVGAPPGVFFVEGCD